MIVGYREFQSRSVRIFISSTFQDMNAERNLLVEDVFPRLSAYFAPQGISISEVDLRWGIPESLASDRRTLRICIEEIENCQPFFMGILGKREGYHPSEDEVAQLDEHMRALVDLDGSHGISITEMEMNAGINTSTPATASFHVREEDARHSARLDTFERRVSELGYPCQRYDSLEDFANQVIKAIVTMVTTHFGSSSLDGEDELYRRQLAHLISTRKGVVPSSQLQGLLRLALEGNSIHICAGKGLGKTSALAYLATELGDRLDQDVFFHFALDGTASSATELWQRLATYLGGTVSTDETGVDEVGLLLRDNPRSRRTYILVDDAASYAGHQDVRGRLLALGEIDPQLVVICTAGDDPITWHGTSAMLEPLEPTQVSLIARTYFQDYGKMVEDSQVDQLIENPALRNPLLLRFVLNEQRTSLSFQSLKEEFGRLARVTSLEEGLAMACERVATQLGELGLHPELTWQVIAVLASAKQGLFQEDVFDSTGALPLEWSIIRAALASVLHEYDGLWAVTNEGARTILRSVAESHHPGALADAQESLINLFLTQGTDARPSDELGHLYAKREDINALLELLGDYARAKSLVAERREALVDYLTLVQDRGDELAHHLFTGIRESSAEEETVGKLLQTLNAAGCYQATISLATLLSAQTGRQGPALPTIEKHEARAHYKLGATHYQRSIELYDDAIAQLEGKRDASSLALLAELTFKRAIVQKSSGHPHDARASYEQAIALFQTLGIEDGNASWALGNLASLLYLFGEDELCRQTFKRAVAMRAKAFGERSPEVAWTYCYYFSALFSMGDADAADHVSHDAMCFYAESYGINSPQFAWTEVNRGNLLVAMGQLEEGRALLLDSIEKNDRFMGGGTSKPGSLSTYSLTSAGNLAVIDWLAGKHEDARARLEEVAAYTSQVHGERHPYTCNAQLNVIFTGSPTEAAQKLPCILGILAEELGEDVPDARFVRKMLEVARGRACKSIPGAMGGVYLARNNGAQLLIVPSWARR